MKELECQDSGGDAKISIYATEAAGSGKKAPRDVRWWLKQVRSKANQSAESLERYQAGSEGRRGGAASATPPPAYPRPPSKNSFTREKNPSLSG